LRVLFVQLGLVLARSRHDEQVLHIVACVAQKAKSGIRISARPYRESAGWRKKRPRTSENATGDTPRPRDPDLQIDLAIRQDPDDPVIPPPGGPDGSFGIHTQPVKDAVVERGRVQQGAAV
jgi:hypothetical protein